MRAALPVRRMLALAAAIAVVLVLLVGARPAVEELRERGVLPAGANPNGEHVELAPGIQVALQDGDSPPAGGSSGTLPSPGPGADGGSEAVLPSVSPGGSRQSAGVLRVPNIRVAVGAILVHAGGADTSFVYRAAVDARDGINYPLAIELFDAVVTAGGPLAPFAELRAAQTAELLEDASAADRFAVLLAPDGRAERLPTDVLAVALLEGARSFESAVRSAEALAALERIDGLSVGVATSAEALSERARLLEAAGDTVWTTLAVRTLDLAPGSTAARAALDLLDARGAAYPGMSGALVAYRGFRNIDATTRYEDLLDSGSLSADEQGVAWFYLGALRERAYERERALSAYASSLAAAPDGVLAPDARYWRGRVMEELGWPRDAAAEYDRLLAEFPGSRFAEDGRLRAAVALGLAGEGAEATSRLAAITRTGSPSAAAEAAHWHAVLVALFDAPAAEVAPAASYDPSSYAAVFEQAGSAVTGPLPAFSTAEVPAPIPVDRLEIDLWLAQAGRGGMTSSPVLQAPEVRLAWTLSAAGEPGVARGLLFTTVNARRGEPSELVSLALEAGRHGLHDVAMRAAQAVLAPLGPAERLEAPRGLLGLAYPVPYLAAVSLAAEEFSVPPLLMYALIRQESAFHPEAGSSAGAFGLTQVIPPTGDYIARALGEQEWRFGDLARPEVSARFGAYYLALQLAEFDGHMLAALAAYNGGPGNAARWLGVQQFPGPDGYLYAVDFTETRLYLELVSSNYAIYRYLYLELDTPRLPHG